MSSKNGRDEGFHPIAEAENEEAYRNAVAGEWPGEAEDLLQLYDASRRGLSRAATDLARDASMGAALVKRALVQAGQGEAPVRAYRQF